MCASFRIAFSNSFFLHCLSIFQVVNILEQAQFDSTWFIVPWAFFTFDCVFRFCLRVGTRLIAEPFMIRSVWSKHVEANLNAA
jgi:hypothetical protein